MRERWYRDKAIEDFTESDWHQAKKHMNANAYNKMRSLASRAGIAGQGDPFTATLVSGETDQHIRSLDTAAVEDFNKKITDWGRKVQSQLRSSASGMVKNDRSLSKSIRCSFMSKRGELSAIGFSFVREGAWIHYGAGKNYAGDGSRTQWYDRHGIVRKARQDSLYKAGSGKRKPINWFNPVIEANISELADIVAEYSSTISLNLSHIYMH